MHAILLSLALCGPFTVEPGFVVTEGASPRRGVAPHPDPAAVSGLAVPVAPTTPTALTPWTRVDSRGGTWTHMNRATLDAHVDAVERSYAGRYGAPAYGSACANGQCGGVSYAPQARRSGFRLFGRR